MGVEYRHYLVPLNRVVRPSPARIAALLELLVAEGWLPRPPVGAATYPFVEEDFEDSDMEEIPAHAYLWDGESSVRVPAAASLQWAESLPPEFQIVVASENVSLAGVKYPFTSQQHPDARLSWRIELAEDLAYEPSVTEFTGQRTSISQRITNLFRRPKESPPVLCACGARLDYATSFRDPIEAARIRIVCPACARPFDPSNLPAVVRDGYGTAAAIPGGLVRCFSVVVDCEKSLPGSKGAFGIRPELVQAVEHACCVPFVGIPFWY